MKKNGENLLFDENSEPTVTLIPTFDFSESETLPSPRPTDFPNSSDNEGQSGIVYGVGHAFAISAPENWILDTESGVSNGIYAIFYPKDETLSQGWTNLDNVMYANVSLKEGSTLAKTIEYDLGRFSQAYPNAEVEELVGFQTDDGKEPAVLKLQAEGYGIDLVAYIEEEEVVVFVVSHSNMKESFEESLEAFKELLASYYFIGEAVSP